MGENEQKGWWMLWWRQSRISSFKENKGCEVMEAMLQYFTV